MALGESISGMLNLAAMCVGFSAAYVGWDKISPSEEDYESAQRDAKQAVNDALSRLEVLGLTKQGFNSSIWRRHFRFGLYLYVLCKIADVGGSWGWRRGFYLVLSQYYIPCLNFFRKRQDKLVAQIITILSLVIFLVMTAATVSKISLIDNPQAGAVLFAVLSVMLGWIIATNVLAYRMRKLAKLTSGIGKHVSDSLGIIAAQSMKDIKKFHDKVEAFGKRYDKNHPDPMEEPDDASATDKND